MITLDYHSWFTAMTEGGGWRRRRSAGCEMTNSSPMLWDDLPLFTDSDRFINYGGLVDAIIDRYRPGPTVLEQKLPVQREYKYHGETFISIRERAAEALTCSKPAADGRHLQPSNKPTDPFSCHSLLLCFCAPPVSI